MVFIVNVLIIKFRLECNIHKQENYSVLYIKSKSIKKNLHNMLPYIHPTMLYKFKGPKYKLKSEYTTWGPKVRRYSSGRGNSVFNNFLPSTLSLPEGRFFGVRSLHNGSSPVIPVKIYANADILKQEIVQDNKGKVGIYR